MGGRIIPWQSGEASGEGLLTQVLEGSRRLQRPRARCPMPHLTRACFPDRSPVHHHHPSQGGGRRWFQCSGGEISEPTQWGEH